MELDYFEQLEDFYLPECDPRDATKARAAILETLENFELEVSAAEMTDADLRAQPGYVLFAWRHDRDLSLAFYAIPDSKLSPTLAAALSAAHNSTYTDFEMSTGHENAEAFARIDAAMGVPGYEQRIQGLSVADSDKECLSTYRVAYFEDSEQPKIKRGAFDKRFVAASAVRRSQ
jgi:hypothetical protein